jgi:hypothetical protein
MSFLSGGGSVSTPHTDTSAYEAEVAEQNKATQEAKDLANKKEALNNAAAENAMKGRASTILMSDDERKTRPTLGGSVL